MIFALALLAIAALGSLTWAAIELRLRREEERQFYFWIYDYQSRFPDRCGYCARSRIYRGELRRAHDCVEEGRRVSGRPPRR